MALTAGGMSPAASSVPVQPAGATVPEAAVIPSRDVAARVVAAQQDRLIRQAAAYATARRTNAEAVALAAVDAAAAAAAMSGVTTPADLRASLVSSRHALEGLAAAAVRSSGDVRSSPTGTATGQLAHAPRADWATDLTPNGPAGRAVMDDLMTARALEIGAQDLYALTFQAELTAVDTVRAVPVVDEVALLDLQASLDAAESLASDLAALPDLEPVVDEAPELDEHGVLRSFTRPRLSSGTRVNDSPWANGDFPDEALCEPESAPGHLLDCDAADAFDDLAAAYLADTGRTLGLNSSYRSYERQVEVKALRGWLAAAPGTSNHGLGIAIDIADAGDVGQFDAPVYLWLTENAWVFGWEHPHYMEPGGSGPPEPWHWEFVG